MKLVASTIVLLLASGALASEDGPSDLDPGVLRSEIPEESAEAGPLAVFAAFEKAWAESDEEALMETLDPEGRVQLAFTGGGPRGGRFTWEQSYYLLKDLLEFTRTDRFEFEKYWNLDSEGRSPYAVAVREYSMNDGASHTDRVYVSLRRNGSSWFVGEIRTVDR